MRLRSLKSEIVRRRTLWIGGTAGLLALILVVGLVSRDDDPSPQPAVSSLELDEQLASQDRHRRPFNKLASSRSCCLTRERRPLSYAKGWIRFLATFSPT